LRCGRRWPDGCRGGVAGAVRLGAAPPRRRREEDTAAGPA
jgi:hypothetical protein